jgi:integrase
MTRRVRSLLEERWLAAGRPSAGWVFPSEGTVSGHIQPSSVRKQHRRAIRESGVVPFVLYSLRHTFLTRLGESRCDAWTLARIAGHTGVGISSRYVHPSDDAVQRAFSRLEEQLAVVENVVSTGLDESGAASTTNEEEVILPVDPKRSK